MKMIQDITSFVFVEDAPEEVDIIFIAGGSWPQPVENAATLWNSGYAPYILPSGKYGAIRGYFPGSKDKAETYKGTYKTEWEFMFDVLMCNGVNKNLILREERAENTYENAFYSKVITDKKGLDIKKAIICCKSFHARRCLMYYSWAYPETKFLICPSDIPGINKNNWFETPDGIERVMGELTRCGTQLKEAISSYR